MRHKTMLLLSGIITCAVLSFQAQSQTKPANKATSNTSSTKNVTVSRGISEKEAAREELQASLKLNMRDLGDGIPVVYPSIWEETQNPNRSKFIEYIATETKGNKSPIARRTIRVRNRFGATVWEKQVGKTEENGWTDSGFRTRTNVIGSRDDSNHLNNVTQLIGGKAQNVTEWKFIDPDSSPFTAVLEIVQKNNKTTSTPPITFEARKRAVIFTHEKEDDMGADGKIIMWYKFGIKAGEDGPSRDPAANACNIYCDPSGREFGAAYDIVTPRGEFWSFGHGSPCQIWLEGGTGVKGSYTGFEGPATPKDQLTNHPYPLASHAQMHCTIVNLVHCSTATNGIMGGGHEGSPSIIMTFKLALDKTIGGGGRVYGDNRNVECRMPPYQLKLTTDNKTTLKGDLYDLAKVYVLRKAYSILVKKNMLLKGDGTNGTIEYYFFYVGIIYAI